MKINTILVPTDFSKNAQLAFNEALELAEQTNAKLIVLHVQSDSALRAAVREGLMGKDVDTMAKARRAVATLIQSRFSEMFAGSSRRRVQSQVVRGDPDAVICGYARGKGADVIFMGAKGASGPEKLRKVLLGSVTQAVIRKSAVPVVVVTEKMRRK